MAQNNEIYDNLSAARIVFQDTYNNELDIIKELKIYLIESSFPSSDINEILYNFYQHINIYITQEDIAGVSINSDPIINDLIQLIFNPNNQNNFINGNQSYSTIYPNSFPNMTYRLETDVGYTNRSVLPRWMTSVQENGLVLGLTRAVVLSYTQPGASKLIAYRLKNSGFELNSID